MECVVSGMSQFRRQRVCSQTDFGLSLSAQNYDCMTEEDSLRPDDEGNKGQPWIMDAPAQYMNLR